MQQYQLPEKTQHCIPNLIREVSDRGATIPDFITLGAGMPSEEMLPCQALEKLAERLLHGDLQKLFQYGPANGDEELKELTRKRLVEKKHFPTEHHSFIILMGSSHGLGLAPRTLCNEGDEVFFEHFSFSCAIEAVASAGCRPVSVTMDEYGMIPEALEKAAQSGKGKYIYMNPNFHNPTGVTMPLERRKDIYAVAQRYGLLIYEDDPYGDIRFRGEDVPAFKSFDVDDRVIFAGSYSKTLTPGVRVGYLYGPEQYIHSMLLVKNVMDGQIPLLNQLIVADTLKSIDYEEHIQALCRDYEKRCDAMIDALTRYGSSKIQFTRPEGGMFLWVTLPDDVSILEFYEALFAHHVGAVRGDAFSADPTQPGHSFRLNYTSGSLETVVEGAKRFAHVTKLFCGA